jgi:glycosyltransferase involved in cell wall biosynthesis
MRGNEVTVLARHGSARRLRRLRAGRVRVVEFPGFGHASIGALVYLVGAGSIAVLRGRRAAFLALQLSSPASVAALASTIWRAPCVVLSTSTGPRGEVAEASQGWRRHLRARVLRRATWLVAQTEDAAAELRRLRADGVVVVPTPVISPARAPGLDGGARALYAGRLVRGKNLRVLVRAWGGVLDVRPDARLTLAGAGIPGDATEQELRDLLACDARLASAVDLPGWVPDVGPLLRERDVFVLLSDAEGMSNALLEAAAHGRICVVNDIPSNRAVLGEGHPLFAPTDDERAIADVILRAFGDGEARGDALLRARAAATRSDVATVCGRLAELLTVR